MLYELIGLPAFFGEPARFPLWVYIAIPLYVLLGSFREYRSWERNDAREIPILLLSPSSFAQEILVLRNQYAAEFRRPSQQVLVVQFRHSVFLCRQDIDLSQAQRCRNGARHGHVYPLTAAGTSAPCPRSNPV